MHSVTLQMREWYKCLLCTRISYIVYVVQPPQNSRVSKRIRWRRRRSRGKWSSLRWIRLRLSYFHLLSHSVDFHLCVYSRVWVWLYRVYQFNSIQFNSEIFLLFCCCFFFTSLNNSLGFQQVLFLYARILFDFYLGLYFSLVYFFQLFKINEYFSRLMKSEFRFHFVELWSTHTHMFPFVRSARCVLQAI